LYIRVYSTIAKYHEVLIPRNSHPNPGEMDGNSAYSLHGRVKGGNDAPGLLF
jgi:hypothetical protein